MSNQGPFRRCSSFDFTFILETKGVSSCTKFRLLLSWNKLMLSFLCSMLFQISHPSPCWICFNMHIQQLIKPKLFFSEPFYTFVLKGAVSFLDVGSLFFTALSCSRWMLFLILIHFGKVLSSFKMKKNAILLFILMIY